VRGGSTWVLRGGETRRRETGRAEERALEVTREGGAAGADCLCGCGRGLLGCAGLHWQAGARGCQWLGSRFWGEDSGVVMAMGTRRVGSRRPDGHGRVHARLPAGVSGRCFRGNWRWV
jgi:hypothetical protein